MELAQFVIIALLVESIVTTVAWVVESKFDWKRITALLVSIALALLARIDLFQVVKIPLALPYVGPALTGLILARGANAFYDLYRSIQNIGKNLANSQTTTTVSNTVTLPTSQDELQQVLNRRI